MSKKIAHDASDAADRVAADRLLVRTGRQGSPWVWLLAVTAVAIAGAELAVPFVLGRAVDALIRDGNAGVWLIWVGLLVAVLVVVDALDDLAVGATTAQSTAWLRHTLLRHVLALGTRISRRFSPGDVASRLVGNAAQAGALAPNIVRAGANLIPGVGGVVALGLIDPWLCLTFLVGVPVLVLIVRAFAREATDVAARYLHVQGTIAGRLVDAISGARTIAAAGTVDREAERVLTPLPELHRHGIDNWRALMRLSVQDAIVVPLLELAVLAVAGAELARGRITPGELLAATQYVLLATMLSGAVGSLGSLGRARAAAERVAEVLAEQPMSYGIAQLPAGYGLLEFRGVSLHDADGERLLGSVDLVIPAGALVAVVGASGAGKSLLAALAGRLVDPDEGEVLLDGIPLSRMSRHELRRQVGYGFERPLLLGETIADAIAFGAYAPSDEELVAAARAAQADDFIQHMPQGYGTRIAEAPMSGGEVQRIGLARTFAHAGRVVVLDDVAASLDTVTEHHIGRALTGELADRTRIVVAHRASTAARADFVVWLDRGRVRATAPHQELWQDPEYRSVFGPGVEPSLFKPNGHSSGVLARINGGGA